MKNPKKTITNGLADISVLKWPPGHPKLVAKMSKHVLIGGGTGFIGQHLAKHLRTQNYEITVISRMPGVRHINWHDLEAGIPKDVSAVVNLAGQNVLDPARRWTAGFAQNVWNSRVNTSAALANAVALAPNVRAFVNVSGVSHYRPNEHKVYSETDSVEAFDYMSKLCVEWEKAATLSADAAKHCRGVKLRIGVVMGRGGGMIENIWLPFQLGLGGPLGSGKQIMPWIHIADLCRLIQHAIESERCVGVLNGVAPEVVTNGEFSKTFAAALHRPCFFPMPEQIVEFIFGKERSALLLSGAKIEPKLTRASGFQFEYGTVKAACGELVLKHA